MTSSELVRAHSSPGAVRLTLAPPPPPLARRDGDVALKRDISVQAACKRLELLYATRLARADKLCHRLLLTTPQAGPPLYWSPAKPCAETEALRGQQLLHRRQSSWGASELFRTFSSSLLPSLQQLEDPPPPPPTPQQQQQQSAPAATPAAVPAVPQPLPGLRFALEAAPLYTPVDSVEPPVRMSPRAEPSAGTPAAETAARRGAWSAPLAPFAAAGRQRVYLQHPASSGGGDGGGGATAALMVTYRVLQSGGRFHLVLFRWEGRGGWKCERGEQASAAQTRGPRLHLQRNCLAPC